MLGRILINFSALLIVSCGTNMSREEYLQKIKPFTINKNVNKNIFKLIDTSCIYKPINDNKDLNYYSMIKFYKKGQLGQFIFFKDDKLSKEFFNPGKADPAIYNYLGNDKVEIQYSSIRQGKKLRDNQILLIKEDTLYNEKKKPLFVKDCSIPKEWLQDWTPDW